MPGMFQAGALGGRGSLTAFFLLALWVQGCGPVGMAKLSAGDPGPDILVIGQASETVIDARYGARGNDIASFVKINNRYYLSDVNGDRVLVFNQAPVRPDIAPSLVLGKTDVNDTDPVSATAISSVKFTGIYSICTLGEKFYMVDSQSNRVLGWNQIPTTSGQPADFVLGQPNFNSAVANYGGAGPTTFNSPGQCATDGTRFYLSDTNNNRILIWNQAPTNSTTPADVVLGQANFTATGYNGGGVKGANSLYRPFGVLIHNSKLYVADTLNRRVLVWSTLPTSNNAAANQVLGQVDFTGQNNTPSSSIFNGPRTLAVHEGKLLVADYEGHRVLVYNTIPTANGVAADQVLCQPDFASVTYLNLSPANQVLHKACLPGDILSDNGKIFISDRRNFRLLGYNSFPSGNFQAFDFVWGEPNLDSSYPFAQATAANTLDPRSISVIDDKLVVSDTLNNRILVFNDFPKQNFANADQVLFQPDMVSSSKLPVSAKTLYLPTSVKSDGTRVYLVDGGNHRVLIWNNKADFFKGLEAHLVLGQPDFTSNLANQGLAAPTASTFYEPVDLTFENGKLAVVDGENHRVLLWNNVTANNQAADLVLGQAGFTTGTWNLNGRSEGSLYHPLNVTTCNGKFLVSDADNNRVLVWNSWPTSLRQSANQVLGQTTFITANSVDSSSNFLFPRAAVCLNSELVVADAGHGRFVVWSSFPQNNGPLIETVFGRSSPLSSETLYYNEISATRFKEPYGLVQWKNRWVVQDLARILIYRYKPY